MYPVILFSDRTAKGLLKLFGVTIRRSWTEAEEGEEISQSELKSQMGQILSQGSDLSVERQQEVINALESGERTVTEILTPRDEIVTLSTEADTDETLSRIKQNPQHVRFPLVGDGLDDLRGFVYSPTVLSNLEALEAGEITFDDLAAPPMRISSETRISRAIDEFQAENQELALVVDANDDVVGLVTVSDAFEAITGELEDPLNLGPK